MYKCPHFINPANWIKNLGELNSFLLNRHAPLITEVSSAQSKSMDTSDQWHSRLAYSLPRAVNDTQPNTVSKMDDRTSDEPWLSPHCVTVGAWRRNEAYQTIYWAALYNHATDRQHCMTACTHSDTDSGWHQSSADGRSHLSAAAW